jgi:hypothetical protein
VASDVEHAAETLGDQQCAARAMPLQRSVKRNVPNT